MRKKELYAYLAGILDGEGYIGIKKSTWGMRNRDDVKSPTYSERIQIRMASPEILQLFKNEFGGNFSKEPRIYQSKSGFKSTKIMWCYRATDKVATKILIATLPYLIEKRRQAKYCLALRQSKESKEARSRKRGMSQKVLDKREALYQDILKIHHP